MADVAALARRALQAAETGGPFYVTHEEFNTLRHISTDELDSALIAAGAIGHYNGIRVVVDDEKVAEIDGG